MYVAAVNISTNAENWTFIVQAFEQLYIVFCGSESCAFSMLVRISAESETSCL